jgi:hypothetical protein
MRFAVSKKRLIFMVIIVAVIIAAAGLVYLLPKLNQPVEGSIVTPLTQNSKTSGASSTKILTTKYYTAQYPVRYTDLTKPTDSASLDAEFLTAHVRGKSGTTSRISFTVTDLPAGGVTEDSSYHLFKSQPAVYTLDQATVQGEPVYVGTRTNPDYERTYLWPHGKYLLTVALSTSASTADTNAELQAIMDHLQWTDKADKQ